MIKTRATAFAAADLERYIASPGFASRERVAALKLAWDLIGSEFAGRHEQYEKFYGGVLNYHRAFIERAAFVSYLAANSGREGSGMPI